MRMNSKEFLQFTVEEEIIFPPYRPKKGMYLEQYDKKLEQLKKQGEDTKDKVVQL